MTDNYYLINAEIKFYFDIEKQYLEHQGKTEQLEPKEAQILKYILEHSEMDGLLKSEDILDNNWDYWNDKKVLQKVLSTLRKKFKNIDVLENGFVAAGSNYKINFQGVLVNSKFQQQKEKSDQKTKIVSSIQTAIIWAFAGAVTLFAIIKANEEPIFTVDDIIQATAISGVSSQPALSPDGSALAFSHRKKGTSQIYLKIDSNLNFQPLTQGHYDQVPAWSPSGRQIAFQRFENGICEIRLIRLAQDNTKFGNDDKIVDCSPFSAMASISWETENTLFFTDAKTTTKSYEIKRVDIEKKKVTPYYSYSDDANYFGSGHYYIVYNEKLKSLFSLESPNWVISTINKIHKNNTVTQIQQVDDIILSIDVFERHIIFKDLDNQLKAFDINKSDELTTIYKNPLKPIGYPTVSANNNKIAIVSGSVFKNNIYAMSLKTGEISEIISSQFRLKVPQEVDNEILYISEETGIYQIYSFSNNIRTRLTNFTKNSNIVYFTLSNDKKWIAINFINSTVLYQRHKNGITAIKTFPLMSYPAFSLNSERILLTNLSKDPQSHQTWNQELIEYNLDDFSETGITVKNARYGKYHEKGIIFVSTEIGINLFKLDGIESIVKFDGPGSPTLFTVNQDSMFISSINNVRKINLDTKEEEILPAVIKGQITVNDAFIFFETQDFGNMDIFKGQLTKN